MVGEWDACWTGRTYWQTGHPFDARVLQSDVKIQRRKLPSAAEIRTALESSKPVQNFHIHDMGMAQNLYP